MRLRSLLFVPGDRPERFNKAAASGADAIILDLEDSVAPEAKQEARAAVATCLGQSSEVSRLVRINPVDAGCLSADVDAARGADGVVLPKAEGSATIHALVDAWGAACLPILPIATETPAAIFRLGDYATVERHLCGLTWGAEDLPAAIGAAASREADGRYTQPYELVRSLTLFAAHAAGVAAIETVFPALSDDAGLAAYAARGARDGFTGMMAIHPRQVPIINAAFAPSDEALDAARRLLAAAAEAGQGAFRFEGRMVDAPHLKQARALLARAGRPLP
ncbi:CoA ester lyase [uncultured Sphingomonas sp.]|uniref:HpcH/HpaI aldolase/citrate lyase family protein n=1 Tax=uncultured Sphingomonas sp. TaxID=158754 RepID=UPI0025D61C00|nr:CoA ester lyase [uncultured Sphingomonas sp.]